MMAFALTLMVTGIIVLLVATSILRGYVLSILWGWFAVPILGLPPLGIPQAMGIALIVSLLTSQYVPSKEGDNWQPLITSVLIPFVALLIGWIVRHWL